MCASCFVFWVVAVIILIPCSRVLAQPRVVTVAHLTPAGECPALTSEAPCCPLMVQLAARASHDSAVLLSLPCCGDTIRSPGAWRCTRLVLCLSHPWAILCSFSLSSHCSHQCYAPKPWDPRTAPRHLPRRRALSERAKLMQDSAGRGCTLRRWCGEPWPDGRTTEGAHPGRPARGSAHVPPFPRLCHIIEVIIPANLQTEHFVNLHRERIQQSRV